MKTRNNILIVIFLAWVSAPVWAQQVIDRPQLYKRPSPYERYTTYRVSVTGGLGLPMGTFKDFMAKNTLHNYQISVDFVFPQNNFSAGFNVGSQYFQHRLPRQVYRFDGQDVSAVQTRALSVLPVVVTGSYHFTKVTAPIRPFVQAGIGGAFAELANYYGTIATGDNGFKLVAQASAGVRVLFSSKGNLGIEAAATYQHIPFDVASEGIKDVSSLNARVGLFYRWW
ncbi:MAG: hypothetical protein R2822_22645 [Spirosomataceae bacterium]